MEERLLISFNKFEYMPARIFNPNFYTQYYVWRNESNENESFFNTNSSLRKCFLNSCYDRIKWIWYSIVLPTIHKAHAI